jgi:two-component system sensor histidine kinase DesK
VSGFDPWQWPMADQRDAPRQSRAVRARAWLVVVVLAALLALSVQRMPHDTSAPRWALLVLDLGYLVSFLLIARAGRRASNVVRTLMVCWLLLLGVLPSLITGDTNLLLYLIFVIIAAVLLLPAYASRLVGLAVALVQVVMTWAMHGSVDEEGTWILILLTFTLSLIFLLTQTVAQLRATQDMLVHQTVLEERGRVARDLHDVLGHTVAVIALKGGLARRMLEAGVDQAELAAELRDIEELSRTAMSEIRTTVLDTRSASLEDELAGARVALRGAGIDAVMPPDPRVLRTELCDVFAYVLREGITNVLKHGGASRCEIRLGAAWMEIENDGPGGRPGGHGEGGGYGLSSLAERLRAVDGHITTSRPPHGGFLLRAEAAADPGGGHDKRRGRFRGLSRTLR